MKTFLSLTRSLCKLTMTSTRIQLVSTMFHLTAFRSQPTAFHWPSMTRSPSRTSFESSLVSGRFTGSNRGTRWTDETTKSNVSKNSFNGITDTVFNWLMQGFSTFWYLRTPKSKLYPSAYPQIRIASPSCTPKSKILPKWASFECFFVFVLCTTCKLLTYPRLRNPGLMWSKLSRVPGP